MHLWILETRLHLYLRAFNAETKFGAKEKTSFSAKKAIGRFVRKFSKTSSAVEEETTSQEEEPGISLSVVANVASKVCMHACVYACAYACMRPSRVFDIAFQWRSAQTAGHRRQIVLLRIALFQLKGSWQLYRVDLISLCVCLCMYVFSDVML